jgi:hypothetical protein
MIYTSSFKRSGRKAEALGIARWAPRLFRGQENKLLAPSKRLFDDYKKGKIDWAGYEVRYKGETLSILNPLPLKVPAILARTSGLLFTRMEMVFSLLIMFQFQLKEL